MHVKKPRRSPLRLRFLTYILEEISCVICISYFPTIPKKMQKELPADWVRTIKKHMDRLAAADCFGDFLKLGLGKLVQHCLNNSEKQCLIFVTGQGGGRRQCGGIVD